MFNKFISWILGEAHKWHKIREVRYRDKAYEFYTNGYTDEEWRDAKKYEYHRERCTQIDTLIYAIEGS